MTAVQKIIAQFKKKLSNPFLRNVGWMGGAEVIPRLLRLGVVVILARYLTSYDYGLAAIVATVGEFTGVFSRIGISAKIIQAEEQELETLCDSAYWLNWAVYLSLFVIQCLVAFPISWFYQESRLILPICVAAITYLMLPISEVQYALIQRENRLKITAITSTIQNSLSYLLSAIFAFLGMGVWSIVLPGVLTAFIWVFAHYTNHSWRPTTGFTTKYWSDIFHFGKHILGVQLLRTLRNNFDYLIVGRFVGIKELGIYFFGFNAGLGISLSIIGALNAALLPHLCEVRSNWLEFKQRYLSSIKTICFVIIPLILLQSGLAPFYVPVLFGQKWVVAIPILVLICLSAIPRPFADAASQLLIAIGKPDLDFRWNILFTVTFAGALLIGVQWGAIGVATSVLLVHAIFLPLFTFWATRYVFAKFGSNY